MNKKYNEDTFEQDVKDRGYTVKRESTTILSILSQGVKVVVYQYAAGVEIGPGLRKYKRFTTICKKLDEQIYQKVKSKQREQKTIKKQNVMVSLYKILGLKEPAYRTTSLNTNFIKIKGAPQTFKDQALVVNSNKEISIFRLTGDETEEEMKFIMDLVQEIPGLIAGASL